MKKRLPIDLRDYWEILLRRRLWILITPLIIGGGTLAVVWKMPKLYRSQTLILVEPQRVPADYIKPTVTTDVEDRLQTISQEILSRTRLEKIIDQFGLYRGGKSTGHKILDLLYGQKNLTQEDAVEQMRKDISVTPIVDDQARDHSYLGAFTIAYQGSDPTLVQQVTRQIASLFIEENLRVREQQAEGTDQFIDSELEKARQDLQAEENRLKDFKGHHMGTLPEQQQANLQLLGQFQAALQANADAVSRAQEQKTYYQSLLNALAKPDSLHVKPALQSELESRRADLAMAEQKYSPENPDVVRLRGEVKALERLSQQLDSKTQDITDPHADATDQIQSQIAALDQEIKRRGKQQAEIEGTVKQMQARVEALPTVEQQLSEISRDYAISKENYQSLLQKKDASAMAAEMERRAEGEQFRILDPASYPDKPYKPDVAQVTLLGCLAGILSGCALAFVVEYTDKSINTDRDAAYYLPTPLLASLPVVAAGKSEVGLTLGRPGRRRQSDRSIISLAVAGDNPRATQEGVPEIKAPAAFSPASRTDADGSVSQTLLEAAASCWKVTPGAEGQSLPRAMERTWKLPAPVQELVMVPDCSSLSDVFAREQFRIIRTRLWELMRVRDIRTLMVTSAVEGEGKTLVSANLAFALSDLDGLRVLLLDADLQKANLGAFLRMKPELGLNTCLQNGKGLADVRWRLGRNLDVVPTLREPEHSAELLNGQRMRSFLEEAVKDHDLVVIDAPPLLPVADAQVLTSIVDAAIMVVRARYCPYDLARSAVELLQPKLIGVVLNAVERFPHHRYYYGYYDRRPEKQEWSRS